MYNNDTCKEMEILTEQECRLLSLYRSASERDREGIIALIEYTVECGGLLMH